jgi:hypothetical protein
MNNILFGKMLRDILLTLVYPTMSFAAVSYSVCHKISKLTILEAMRLEK